MFFGVFLTEEVDGVGDNRLGDSTVVDVQTHMETFFNVPLRFTYFDEYSSWYKTKLLVLGLPTKVLDYQDFRISDIVLKEFCCTLICSFLGRILQGENRRKHFQDLVSS